MVGCRPALLAQARLDLLETGRDRGPTTAGGHGGAGPAVALEARLGGVLLAGDRVLDRGGPGQRERLVVPDADDAVGLVPRAGRQCGLVAGVVLLRDPAEDRSSCARDGCCGSRRPPRPRHRARRTRRGPGPGDAGQDPCTSGVHSLLGQLLRQRLDLNGLRVCFCFLGRGVDVNVDLVRRAPIALSDVSHAYPFRPRPSARGRAAWVPVLFRVGLQGSFPRIGTRGPPQPRPSTAGPPLAFGARPGDPAVLNLEPGAPMEHTTEFLGHIDITPALNEDEIGYLTAKRPRRFRWAPLPGCCFDGSRGPNPSPGCGTSSRTCSSPAPARRGAAWPGSRTSRSTTGWTDGRRLPARYEGADRDHGAREPRQHAHAAGAGPRHAGWPTSAHEQPTDLERAERKRRRREARTSNVIDLSSVFPGPA